MDDELIIDTSDSTKDRALDALNATDDTAEEEHLEALSYDYFRLHRSCLWSLFDNGYL